MIFAIIAVGWGAAHSRVFAGGAVASTASNLAFYIFIPALLFRTTARIDLGTLPWAVFGVFFGPAVGLLLVVYGWHRLRRVSPPAAPAVRAIATTFGNSVQLGLPIVTTLFGEAGLSILIGIISVHALTLLTVATILAELDLARAQARADGARPRIIAIVRVVLRRAAFHPVVLPVLLGMGWNLLGIPLPAAGDELLGTLAQAVAPLCLVAIGLSLAHYGMAGALRQAAALAVGKLLVLPALVLVVAHWGAGLHGVPLATVVLFAALPVGSNPLLFAQRYDARQAEVTAGILTSMLAFTVIGPGWLVLASLVAP
ncbi:MAG: AEC family transporter [Dactylosporangium sp.]|nr:AEC family transporter [Dactylosporangium sp.]